MATSVEKLQKKLNEVNKSLHASTDPKILVKPVY